jgi:hypothetical protein
LTKHTGSVDRDNLDNNKNKPVQKSAYKSGGTWNRSGNSWKNNRNSRGNAGRCWNNTAKPVQSNSITDDSWDDLDIYKDKPADKSQQNAGNSWNHSKPVQKNNDDDNWDNGNDIHKPSNPPNPALKCEEKAVPCQEKIAEKNTDQDDTCDDDYIHKDIREKVVVKEESVEEKWDDEAPECKKPKLDSEGQKFEENAQDPEKIDAHTASENDDLWGENSNIFPDAT